MRRTRFVLTSVLYFSTIAATGTAHALNVETHSLVNAAASGTTSFDLFLQSDLGFLRGLQEPFRDRSVAAWIREGGIREDDVLLTPRFLRHFHDPLQPWDRAGLGEFESSIRWMQRKDQQWSWQAARRSYHTALTVPGTREQAWADTFRGLGQVMHLVVDASVPEHTRNDIHPLESICRTVRFRCYGNYEYWVSDSQAEDVIGFWAAYLSNPMGFDTGIFARPTGDPAAPAPIARLIDTDTYTGDNPNVTIGQAIGIGEFSNANFFSEDTGNRTYRFPSVALLEPSQRPAPKTGRTRAYFKKGRGDGIPVDPAAAECVLFRRTLAEGVLRPISSTCVDENVWEATARLMLPRAVGYARGVLDYFFRGRIEIAPPDRFVYGLAAFQPGNTGAFTKLRFRVRNATPNEEAGRGQLTAVVRYRTSAENLIENPLANISPPLFAVSQAIDLDRLSPTFNEFVFDFSQSPIPTNAADLLLTVVYRGPLGLEEDAVLVGSKDLYEPDPLDKANGSDYDCFNAQIFRVMGLPPYRYPDHVERDVNNDGVVDLYGPYVERALFIKTFDLTAPAPTPSLENFDFTVPQLNAGQYVRFMLLQDQEFYGIALGDPQVEDLATGASRPYSVAVQLNGLLNEVFQAPTGAIVRRVHVPTLDRGVLFLHQIGLAHGNPIPCLPQLRSVPENLTRVDGSLPAE